MSRMRLIESAREAFQQLPPNKRILILHPQFRHHTALINAFLDASSSANPVYVALAQPGTGLDVLWAQLGRELMDLYHVSVPSLSPPINPGVAAEQFAQATAPLAPLMLVLSAYDNADASVHEFVAQAIPHLREADRFLLASRNWPAPLVNRLHASDSLVVLPVAPDDMLLDYLDRDEDRVLLEVRALGSGQVFIDGNQIDQWDGALPRALFFYFVDRGMTTRDEVFATFWPELSTREATNVFHVTKRKISEILGVDLTVYTSGFYRISPRIELHYDVVSFVEAVQNSAVAEPEEAAELLGRAIALHERLFLSDFDQPWAVRRRDELRQTYVDALTALARLREEQGRYTEALGLYNRAFGAFPQREDLARAQMRLYQKADQPQRALAVYDCLANELKRALGVMPSPETTMLAEEIRQSMTA